MPTLVSVQSGSTSISALSTGSYQSITPVNLTSSFLITTYKCSENTPNNGLVLSEFIDSSTIHFESLTDTNTNTKEVCWYVVEFSDGVTVYRGRNSYPDSTQPQPISLPYTYDTTKSFVIDSWVNAGTAFGNDDYIKTWLSSSGETLLMQSFASSVTTDGPLSWQVIEYANCTVQTGSVDFDDTILTISSSITPVNLTKSLLTVNYYANGIGDPAFGGQQLYGTFSGSSGNDEVWFFRKNTTTGASGSISYQVVEFTDNTTVQRGEMNFLDTEALHTASINSVTKTKSFIYLAGAHGTRGNSDYVADDQIGALLYTARFSGSDATATKIQLDRQNTSGNSTVLWQVVEFSSAVTSSPLFVKILDG